MNVAIRVSRTNMFRIITLTATWTVKKTNIHAPFSRGSRASSSISCANGKNTFAWTTSSRIGKESRGLTVGRANSCSFLGRTGFRHTYQTSVKFLLAHILMRCTIIDIPALPKQFNRYWNWLEYKATRRIAHVFSTKGYIFCSWDVLSLFPSHLLSSPFYSLSLLVETQIRGHMARSSPPLPTTVRALQF